MGGWCWMKVLQTTKDNKEATIMADDSKFDWLKSKTVWLSIVGVIYAAAGYFSGNIDQAQAISYGQTALSALFIRLGIK